MVTKSGEHTRAHSLFRQRDHRVKSKIRNAIDVDNKLTQQKNIKSQIFPVTILFKRAAFC